MDYYVSIKLYNQAVAEAEIEAAEKQATLHYDCVSYCAVNSVLEQIYGEDIPQNLLEASWAGELDIISHARTQGWEVTEISPIGCSEHYGDGRAFLARKMSDGEIFNDDCFEGEMASPALVIQRR